MNRVLMVAWVAWVALCAAVVAVGYVRLAPSDPTDWHNRLEFNQNRDLRGGVERVIAAEPDTLARLDAIVRAASRTRVLAGSVEEGHVTYVTRSAVIGFPDYTTVQQDGESLKIYARQRFGRSDFDVNATRVAGWLDALQTR